MSDLMKAMKTGTNEQKLVAMLESRGVELTSEERSALSRCFGVRGKYAGYLKKNAPSRTKEPLANVIWNTIQPNAYKLQMFNLMMLPDKHRDTYHKLSSFKYPAWLDLDMKTLQEWGAW